MEQKQLINTANAKQQCIKQIMCKQLTNTISTQKIANRIFAQRKNNLFGYKKLYIPQQFITKRMIDMYLYEYDMDTICISYDIILFFISKYGDFLGWIDSKYRIYQYVKLMIKEMDAYKYDKFCPKYLKNKKFKRIAYSKSIFDKYIDITEFASDSKFLYKTVKHQMKKSNNYDVEYTMHIILDRIKFLTNLSNINDYIDQNIIDKVKHYLILKYNGVLLK